MSEWQPIDTAPENEPILVFVPRANRGRDSCDVVIVYRYAGGPSYWTNGGPNAGDPLLFDEWDIGPPTHWMALPEPPVDLLKASAT